MTQKIVEESINSSFFLAQPVNTMKKQLKENVIHVGPLSQTASDQPYFDNLGS